MLRDANSSTLYVSRFYVHLPTQKRLPPAISFYLLFFLPPRISFYLSVHGTLFALIHPLSLAPSSLVTLHSTLSSEAGFFPYHVISIHLPALTIYGRSYSGFILGGGRLLAYLDVGLGERRGRASEPMEQNQGCRRLAFVTAGCVLDHKKL